MLDDCKDSVGDCPTVWNLHLTRNIKPVRMVNRLIFRSRVGMLVWRSNVLTFWNPSLVSDNFTSVISIISWLTQFGASAYRSYRILDPTRRLTWSSSTTNVAETARELLSTMAVAIELEQLTRAIWELLETWEGRKTIMNRTPLFLG